MLLLSCVLGRAFLIQSRVGYFAPRARRIRKWLGLDGHGQPSCFEIDLLTFIQGEQDMQCPPETACELRELGYSVTLVPEVGHRLSEPEGKKAVVSTLKGY